MPQRGAEMCRQFHFDEYFDNFLRNERQTRAMLENDIRKAYSQYPFTDGESDNINVDDTFITNKFQEITGKIKQVLKEKYPDSGAFPNQIDFSINILDEGANIMAKDFCDQLKTVHKSGNI